jgi:hypothetical protein
MTVPQYATEGRIREACAVAGVRTTAIEDVIERFRAGQFTEAELPDKLAEWKETAPHFYSGTQADMHAEAIAAFGPTRTLAAQADFLNKHGEAAARDTAAEFGTTLGGKPGKTPEHFKVEDKSKLPGNQTNPWANLPENKDAHGRYTAAAITRQGAVIKGLGVAKAQSIARAAGSFIGATHPNKAA